MSEGSSTTSPPGAGPAVPALPADLDRTYALRAVTPDDAAELHALFVEHRRSVLGFCRATLPEIRAWLEPVPGSDVVNLVVTSRAAGRAVQWWAGFHEGGSARGTWLVHTRPGTPPGDADRLWSAGWDWLRDWVLQVADGPAADRVAHSACLLGDAENQRRLAEAGFRHERTYWEMAGPVTGAPPPPAVPGLLIRGGSPPEVVHRLVQEGFRDHWGFHPQSLDDWLATEQTAPGYEPSWWFVAELDGHPAAAMVLCRYDAELYVQEVATTPPFRRRGIASALLAHAFAVARDAGCTGVMLHVDSDNADGAPRLYRAAGLEVRHATLQHLLPLPTGADAARGAGPSRAGRGS